VRLPRDLSGREFGRLLTKLGYEQSHQRGSHMRFTCSDPEHSLTIPDHSSLRPGTLSSLLRQVMEHHGLTREELLERIFEQQ